MYFALYSLSKFLEISVLLIGDKLYFNSFILSYLVFEFLLIVLSNERVL